MPTTPTAAPKIVQIVACVTNLRAVYRCDRAPLVHVAALGLTDTGAVLPLVHAKGRPDLVPANACPGFVRVELPTPTLDPELHNHGANAPTA